MFGVREGERERRREGKRERGREGERDGIEETGMSFSFLPSETA